MKFKERVKKVKEKADHLSKNGRMTPMSQNIVTVASHHMVRWSCAKTLIAKNNGFIDNVSRRKSFQKNGTVKNVVKTSEQSYRYFIIYLTNTNLSKNW